jgi:TolA-binding protein
MSQFLRALQRKFGISAPRVAVRTHVPWYWRWLGYASLGALVIGVGWTTYDYGMELAGFRQGEAASALARLDEQIRQRDMRVAELRSQVAAAERQMQIERATYGDLAKQVKSLSEENAALREDLAFFQSLMAAGGKENAVSINRFRVQPEKLPGEYRYRLLLVQSGQRVKEFQGKLQFVLNLEQGDRKYVLTLPQEGEKNAREYDISFKFFQRVEGTFKVAPDAVVKSLQIRVFENGAIAPKLSQTVNIS